MTEREKIRLLQEMISQKRLKHSLAVRDVAVDLAKEYGADIKKARTAGLLHDSAKGISNDNLLQMAQEFGIVVDDVISTVPSLLHGPIGAKLVQKEFGIEDKEILNAIKIHTLGAEEMTILEKIIFIADYIEPNRTCAGLDELRKKARVNLDSAIRIACDRTLKYHIRNEDLIHPQTLATRNAFLRKDG
ncbi:bis(5'-nucleosyl)-tetraphosphatase (symmetrical) YqeK [Acetohalobium arabaticum]|uniref:bis(5'-nucleosyl)-tetraphosphatase (symmetrical) n=1 Tax=Acetohalobium arabaticum (strain ATCC 49924 / DSM 5501 / Z-7288) TaxID=574087 RepID=D9QV62_ACEAZ|nr:bis(5'-nucleosyl)-tetraphosphatase (symmetrical) YqeK [Acetohalobium arabaticum]ADL12121.1 metal dependent phosphohydrolase [Acetohalobium arabaticum DSM 5501]